MIDFDAAFSRIDYRLELDEASESEKRQFLKGLKAVCKADTPALNELREWLESTIEPVRIEPPARGDREVVERYDLKGECYQLERIRCGKSNCKCSEGKLHGPYWYRYGRVNGKLRSQYIGKKAPPGLNEPDLSEGSLEGDRWFLTSRATS